MAIEMMEAWDCSSYFHGEIYMINYYIWLTGALLDSSVPIRILVHLIRLYVRSWQNSLVLSNCPARLPGLANVSCEMFGGILPSLVRFLFVGICMP